MRSDTLEMLSALLDDFDGHGWRGCEVVLEILAQRKQIKVAEGQGSSGPKNPHPPLVESPGQRFDKTRSHCVPEMRQQGVGA